MIDLPGVASVVQLVGTAITSAKTARDLAKDSSDHQLKGAISDLYDALIDIKARALELDEENRLLKAQLVEKAKYVGPLAPHGYFYEADDRTHPICPRCIQERPPKIGFMSDAEEWNDGIRRTCRLCQKKVWETEMSY